MVNRKLPSDKLMLTSQSQAKINYMPATLSCPLLSRVLLSLALNGLTQSSDDKNEAERWGAQMTKPDAPIIFFQENE